MPKRIYQVAIVGLILLSGWAVSTQLWAQTTDPNQATQPNSNSGDQKKKTSDTKDADKPSKTRYSTRGLHPPEKTSGDKAQGGDSSKQGPQPAAKPDAKDPK